MPLAPLLPLFESLERFMVRHLLFAVLLYTLCVLETVWPVGTFRPSFWPLPAVLASLWFPGNAGLIWAGASGFAADLISSDPLGCHMMVALLTMMAVQHLGVGGQNLYGLGFFAWLVLTIWLQLIPVRLIAALSQGLHIQEDNLLFVPLQQAAMTAAWVTGFWLLVTCLRRSCFPAGSLKISNRWSMLNE